MLFVADCLPLIALSVTTYQMKISRCDKKVPYILLLLLLLLFSFFVFFFFFNFSFLLDSFFLFDFHTVLHIHHGAFLADPVVSYVLLANATV